MFARVAALTPLALAPIQQSTGTVLSSSGSRREAVICVNAIEAVHIPPDRVPRRIWHMQDHPRRQVVMRATKIELYVAVFIERVLLVKRMTVSFIAAPLSNRIILR